MKTKKAVKPKSKKGKQHPVKAASLDNMADVIDKMGTPWTSITRGELSKIFREETKRVRSIVR